MNSKTAIVVGAGLSGLNAARILQKAGYSVRVIEQLDRPGGRVQTIRVQGFVIDVGADAMTQAYETYLSTVRDLGLDAGLAKTSQVVGVARGGRTFDIDPARRILALFTGAISWRTKFALAFRFRRAKTELANLDSFELVQSAERDDPSVNARQLGERLFGSEATDYLIDPLVRLTSGTGAQSCSMLAAIAPLTSWTAQMINIKGGLDTVPRALAASVPVEYKAEVLEIVESKDRVAVTYRDASGQNRIEGCDYCVIAAMFDAACRMWSPLAEFVPEFGPNLQYVKLISVSLGYDRLCTSKAYALIVPTVEQPDLLVGFLQHNKAVDRAPAGHSLLTFYSDTRSTDRMLGWSDAGLEEWAATFAERAFPELKGHRVMGSVTRWPRAGYLATPGFWRRTRKLLDAIPIDGRVQLAGDLFGAGSMESAIRWGGRAAQRIIDHDKSATEGKT